jgi:uracil-xanthine permease
MVEKNGAVQEELVWEEVPDIVEPVLRIDERPKTVWETVLYGWQHTLVDITPLVFPLIVAGVLKMSPDQAIGLVNATLVAMGVATLIQTTLGNRLPIIQGPSITVGGTVMSVGSIFGIPAMWGAVFVGGIVEMIVGASKVLGALKKVFPIAVAGIVVTCIGFNLGMTAVGWMVGDGSPINFVLGAVVIALIILLQLKTRGIAGGTFARGAIFFSIWIVGLGVAGSLGMVNWELIHSRPWFAFPKLFPYGGPGFGWSFAVGAIFGVLAGYLGSMVESIGDYAATCAVSGETFKVRHMNRGILSEGVGCVIASLLGGLPVTSYTQNIGVIASTRIASRFVVQVAACFLILYGLSPKFGALLAVIPRPVMGGVFMLVCGSIVISGMKLINSAPKTEGNGILVGLTLLLAIGLPVYAKASLGEWMSTVTPFVRMLFTNTVVIAVIVGILLNIIINHVVAKGDKA